MSIYLTEDEIIDDFIAGFSECTLSLPEEKAFMEVMEHYPEIDKWAHFGKNMSLLCQQLPEHKAKDDFDEKMAASFALELEKEAVTWNNSSVAEAII